MDEVKTPQTQPETGQTPARAAERARAAAYLDLWERHLGYTAIHGPPPAASWPRG